jgi:predicted anti-sigma-YlaC factor YlaD
MSRSPASRSNPSDAVPGRDQPVPPVHFPDELRIGVLAGIEDHELRLQAHFLSCDACRESGRALAEFADTPEGRCAPQQPMTCWQARNALFRYFEQGRALDPDALAHLNACECCRDHFLEPARAVRALEDGSSISALD